MNREREEKGSRNAQAARRQKVNNCNTKYERGATQKEKKHKRDPKMKQIWPPKFPEYLFGGCSVRRGVAGSRKKYPLFFPILLRGTKVAKWKNRQRRVEKGATKERTEAKRSGRATKREGKKRRATEQKKTKTT